MKVNELLQEFTFAENKYVDFDSSLASDFVKSTQADIRFGGDCCYYVRPTWLKCETGDYIQMPEITRFVSNAEYFTSLFHELAHWTEARLDWLGDYEVGELIAETTACRLGTKLKVPLVRAHIDRIRKLNEVAKGADYQAISDQAHKVTKYLLELSDKSLVVH